MIARDFESPADANTDNVYEVTLVATDDDGNSASEAFTVTRDRCGGNGRLHHRCDCRYNAWLRILPLPA